MIGLRLQQSTSQRMTQMMQQAMGLLQMDHADLAGYLIAQAAENPCLQVTLPVPAPPPRSVPRPWRLALLGSGEEVDRLAAQADGLYAHVQRQIGLLFRSAEDTHIATIFAEALEPSGWLGSPVDEIAQQAACSPRKAEEILERLHQMEPAGLFARSLAECLRLQLLDQDALSPAMARLLQALPLLAQGDTAALMAHCEVDAETLAALVTRLRQLDPKPGIRFDAAPELRRPPDLIAERDTQGKWQVTLNAETTAKITVDPLSGADYRAARAEARWIDRTLSRRNALVLRVAAHVLSAQRDFLDHGATHLRPLSCADVAEDLGLHETTIGRVRSGLLVQTPSKTVPLRAFFARGGTKQGDGSQVPAAALSAMIAALIQGENKTAPLTDSEISQQLAGRGLAVSRRTVANRRRDAGHPAAAKRRARQHPDDTVTMPGRAESNHE
ncbi:RNA polymerase factor sigma-54 [Antarcticimicrobium sediminis]|uniref:RNA polymerase sigma-54 factor n=1 Tax=Antarcticimicrobium sediminis TaxID=2546227 RepID=A0A4R5EM21_9RHOB|nr:RNA polymerase factor sigma-54 [Antarcticimicrobium sediminis]TDE35393.1 RNA polymerase sigma-54 factor [Antarcticimicrobium sediminis]